MGNVAASGGYWVSTAGDRIFAEPETITGSIGIFGVIPTFEDALAQWGVTSDGVRTTPMSGQPDLLGGLTPETETMLQKSVDFGYQRFLGLVATSRKMPAQRVDEIGQGRVWDGGSARQIGLVDQFGDLQDALDYAAGAAKLKKGDWHPVYLSEKPSAWESTLAGLLGDDSDSGAGGTRHDGLFRRPPGGAGKPAPRRSRPVDRRARDGSAVPRMRVFHRVRSPSRQASRDEAGPGRAARPVLRLDPATSALVIPRAPWQRRAPVRLARTLGNGRVAQW